ncbi:MAG: hypothetical protein AB7G25_12200 [Sphingomonadaceae bacterium]
MPAGKLKGAVAKVHFAGLAILAVVATPSFAAKKKARNVWEVTRVTDPITSETSCVVAVYDQGWKSSYSRFGYLYPMVETNSRFGLLVGISSGGKVRLPVGDILWRVDDKPYRQLRAMDNPRLSNTATSDTNPASKAIIDVMALTTDLAASMTATSTVASGQKAQEMLAEMLSGASLMARAAAAAPSYGLPSDTTFRVGQLTKEGIKPFPIDESFRRGIEECGISPQDFENGGIDSRN